MANFRFRGPSRRFIGRERSRIGVGRAQQTWHYADDTDLPLLAAAYAYGLVRNHPYRDGNKRIGFLAMVTFLGVNGHDFSATHAEVVAELMALADGSVSESALADWIREHSSKHP